MWITSRAAPFWASWLVLVKYWSKFVASLVVFLIGVVPLFSPAPCAQAVILGGCCRPDCPMMAMSKAGKAHCTDGSHSGAANTCKVTLPPPMSPGIPGKSANSLSLGTRTEVIVDRQPRLTAANNSFAVLRRERTLDRLRSSLCILLI